MLNLRLAKEKSRMVGASCTGTTAAGRWISSRSLNRLVLIEREQTAIPEIISSFWFFSMALEVPVPGTGSGKGSQHTVSCIWDRFFLGFLSFLMELGRQQPIRDRKRSNTPRNSSPTKRPTKEKSTFQRTNGETDRDEDDSYRRAL